jgi:molecular chaperone GrpE (heat shock protein)
MITTSEKCNKGATMVKFSLLLLCGVFFSAEGFLPAVRRARFLPSKDPLQLHRQRQQPQDSREQQQQLVAALPARPTSWAVVAKASTESEEPAVEEKVGEEEVAEETVAEESSEAGEEGEEETAAAAAAGEEEEEEEEEEEPEDPELVALKEELESLEKSITSTKKELSATQEKLVEAGQTGYLRQAANVENYKRRTKDSKKDEEGTAMLAVTKAFFGKKEKEEASVMEQFRDGLTTLPVAESAEAEAKLHESYQALYRDMVDKFSKFGLQEYHAVSICEQQLQPPRACFGTRTRYIATDRQTDTHTHTKLTSNIRKRFQLQSIFVNMPI